MSLESIVIITIGVLIILLTLVLRQTNIITYLKDEAKILRGRIQQVEANLKTHIDNTSN